MDLIAQVRGEIADQLGVAPARLETVAQELRLSPRSLQRKLADHGVSFSKLVSETRRQTAARLLGDTDLSMSDIALMLGLSQSSAFTRATQRWFGMSPRRVRMQLRAEWRGSGAKEQCFFL
jgi:AraC-like DNA-binding protein